MGTVEQQRAALRIVVEESRAIAAVDVGVG
jgi:hypothetical protein